MNSTKIFDKKPATDESSVVEDRRSFLIFYMCIVIVGIVLTVSQSFSFYRMCLRISVNLHEMIFNSVTRAKMIFFHNNSSGRILNRFTKDINCVDTSLPTILIDVFNVSFNCEFLPVFCISFFNFNQSFRSIFTAKPILFKIILLQGFLQVVSVIVINAIVNPWLLIPATIIIISFGFLRIVYIKAARCFKRIESLS